MENKLKNKGWDVSVSADGLRLFHENIGVCRGEVGGVTVDGGFFAPESVRVEDDRMVWVYGCGLELCLTVNGNRRDVTAWAEIRNRSERPLPVGDLVLLDLHADWTRAFFDCYLHGRTMCNNTGRVSLDETVLSNSVVGLTDAAGQCAFAAGAIRPDDAWYDFQLECAPGNESLQVICRLENSLLAAGATRRLSPVRLYAGTSMSFLLERYAEDTAEQLVPCSNFKTPPTGWCSWYHYYGTDTEGDIRQNMDAIKASPVNGGLQVIQIDDGWNRDRDAVRNWGDWLPEDKFPDGMKALADQIHADGFQAGLWLAPFSVDAGSRLYKEHPEWLVQAAGSEDELDPLAAPGGVFGLDLTRPDVQEFIRTTFRRVFHDWGFDYIKIDFLAHGAIEGQRSDQSKTGIEAFRIGMRIIREEAGSDRFILNCGSPIAASVGLCDGMRIGMDVGGRWFAPMNLQEWRYGNCCLKAAANSTIWRQWMNGVWWHNDPDCVILRNSKTEVEWKTFKDHPLADAPVRPEDFSLSSEETLGWLRLVWLSGGMFIVSEDMARLTKKQWADLASAAPLNHQPVRRVDYYSEPDVSVLTTVSGVKIVGLFNLSDESVTLSLKAEKLGVSPGERACVEKWSGDRFEGRGDTVEFPPLPPHSGRLWQFA
jgi:alpha-galactosidase